MKKQLLLFIIIVLLQSFSIPEKIEQKIDKEVKQAFDIELYSKEPILIKEEIKRTLPIEIPDGTFFKISSNENLLGYYYYGRTISKVDTFDYLIILDEELIIKKVKVLVYKEDYGGEIGSKRWLKQFIGKKEGNLQYKKNIVGISGATISARSMTIAINDFLKSITILHQTNSI